VSARRSRGDQELVGYGAPAEPGRRRRSLRILGVLLLAAALVAFVVSFISGIGDGRVGDRITGDAEQGGEALDRIGARVRVEVLNAGGVAGLARRATEHLRDRGFDVVYIGNAGTFEQDSTVVVARTADLDAAHRVARALGMDSVVVEPDPQLFVDATVRLGKNWPRAAEDAPVDPGMFGQIKGWFSSGD
jgi:hypothetical protein